MKYNWQEENVRKAVSESLTYSETLMKLGVPKQGNNISTLKKKIEEYQIDISHFTFTHTYLPKKEQDINVYLTNKQYISSFKLKEKLLRKGIKEYKCECCNNSEWNGKKIPLELHHIDGDNKNNMLDNIQILCPNCHAQTESYCKPNKEQKVFYCESCGKPLRTKGQYRNCPRCAALKRKKVSFEKEELEELVKTHSNIEIGKKFGVSEATIRKWRKKFNI